jgi:hypothetical protein
MATIRILIQVEPYQPLEVATTEGDDPDEARNAVSLALHKVAEDIEARGLMADLERPVKGRNKRLS